MNDQNSNHTSCFQWIFKCNGMEDPELSETYDHDMHAMQISCFQKGNTCIKFMSPLKIKLKISFVKLPACTTFQ